eukprot:COSAG02_NODE_8112_length_2704_cov_3.709789_1_plen_42_part_00
MRMLLAVLAVSATALATPAPLVTEVSLGGDRGAFANCHVRR